MASWTRAIRFVAVEDGQEHLGEPVDAEQDVGLATYEGREVQAAVIEGASLIDPAAKTTDRVLTVKRLLCPLRESEVGTIRCIGLNYRKHADEAKAPYPAKPVLFLKPVTSLNGPWPDPIVVPRAAVALDTTDYEAEAAIVIGKTCKDVSEADALDYVLAYAASNDVSFRKWQESVTSQWCFGKGIDKAAPVGPCLVRATSVPDWRALEITGSRNGKVVQHDTLDLIHSIPAIIAHLSTGTTLPAGTLILTGTPSGIGLTTNNLLQKGDVFTVHLSGGVGSLINVVEHEGEA